MDLRWQGAGERQVVVEGEKDTDGSFSEELMCFMGVFPPESRLKRAGEIRALGEEPRTYTHNVSTAPGCSFLAHICVDISWLHFLFSCISTCICKERKAGHCLRLLGSRGRVRRGAHHFPDWTGALVKLIFSC